MQTAQAQYRGILPPDAGLAHAELFVSFLGIFYNYRPLH